VVLTGVARSRQETDLAAQKVQGIKGVKSVRSH
jgi:osmotically-inducible protein OsmY